MIWDSRKQFNSMKKILGITGNRADYDLMAGLYSLLHSDLDIDFRLLVGGTHLSSQYGFTINNIKKDGFKILHQVESLIHSDSAQSRLKSASIFLQNSVDVVGSWDPDIIIYAGDREDVIIGALLGVYLYTPTIHFFGGDHEKDGHPDTVIRQAASKLSTMHLVSHQIHKERLISLGEPERRIEVIGSVALDRFKKHRCSDVTQFFPKDKSLRGFALVIYHPLDPLIENPTQTYMNIISSLKHHDIPAILIYPNSDPGSESVIRLIEEFSATSNFWGIPNFDRQTFLSLFKSARFLIGNSSAGIIEAASIPKAVINVGTRQLGRFADENVLFCSQHLNAIIEAISCALQENFQKNLSTIKNSYGDGNSCERAYKIIKDSDLLKMQRKTEDSLLSVK